MIVANYIPLGYFLVSLGFVVAIVEAFTQVFKMIWKEDQFDWVMVVAGVFGALFTFLFKIDLLSFFEFQLVSDAEWLRIALNVLILGVVFMRYSGNLNDILEWLNGLRPSE